MRLPSVMSHNFSSVPQANIQRSRFDRSHGFKGTFNSGYLVPFFVDEIYPGDTANLQATLFARLATPEVPFMDNLYCATFFFFVPHRLVHDNFQKQMGEQIDPGDSIDYLTPQMVAPVTTGYAFESLQDYMGIPPGLPGISHDARPMRAYNLIYNQWFRDQNLQDSLVVDRGDGPDTVTNYVLRKRGKRHDYFTSCLPAPQKGASVPLPLGTTAPVRGIGKGTTTFSNTPSAGVYETDKASTTVYASYANIAAANADSTWIFQESPTVNDRPGIYADLSVATAATINALRSAIAIQQFLERDSRSGTRYTEIVRSHFRVVSPDARLQRPEYLGGNVTPINVTPVTQTSATDAATTPQGNLAAVGTMTNSGTGFVKSFVEHGYVIGLACVYADLNYQQGLERFWSRRTRYDYMWPEFAHLGEQAVLNKEIYAQGTANPTQDVAVFGYQEQYADLKYKPSRITGKFRSSYSAPLDNWHLAQEFGALPTLSATFIEEAPPLERVLAVTDEPQLLLDVYNKYTMARALPTNSIPGLKSL